MKYKLIAIVLLGAGLTTAQANSIKLYDVKSGKITYEIKGSGNMMGAKMQIVGKKRLIFDNNGAKNLTEEAKIQKQSFMGKKNATKTHTINYSKDGINYRVDFKHKKIMRMGNVGMEMASLIAGGKSIKQAGEDMMKQMGGKKIGTDKVLGYSCDVWSLMGVKQCIYKGITLRVVSNVMGLKIVEVATKAEFDISLSKDDFKLPDFPIYDMQGNKLDKSQLDDMDKHDVIKNKKSSQEMAELGAIIAEAVKKAGVKKGENPTKIQAKNMENAMMNTMFPRMKQKLLSQSEALHFAKICFGNADTKAEAQVCARKMDSMTGEVTNPEEVVGKWDAQKKAETLKFIDEGLVGTQCAQKATNMNDLQRCMQ